jgi:hypothetical protein
VSLGDAVSYPEALSMPNWAFTVYRVLKLLTFLAVMIAIAWSVARLR